MCGWGHREKRGRQHDRVVRDRYSRRRITSRTPSSSRSRSRSRGRGRSRTRSPSRSRSRSRSRSSSRSYTRSREWSQSPRKPLPAAGRGKWKKGRTVKGAVLSPDAHVSDARMAKRIGRFATRPQTPKKTSAVQVWKPEFLSSPWALECANKQLLHGGCNR